MIAPVSVNNWQSRFLEMLPAIRVRAKVAFAGQKPEAKEDAVAEVVARCYVDYLRLVERGLEHLAFPSVLASFAIRQCAAGRRVGTKTSSNDVFSKTAQRKNGHELVEIGSPGEQNAGGWRESLVETKKTGPADTAASRIDINGWLRSLCTRDRGVAETLAIDIVRNKLSSTAKCIEAYANIGVDCVRIRLFGVF